MKNIKQQITEINTILDRVKAILNSMSEDRIMSDKEEHEYLQREYFNKYARANKLKTTKSKQYV